MVNRPTPQELDERVTFPLDPKVVLDALLKVDPDSEPVADEPDQDDEG